MSVQEYTLLVHTPSGTAEFLSTLDHLTKRNNTVSLFHALYACFARSGGAPLLSAWVSSAAPTVLNAGIASSPQQSATHGRPAGSRCSRMKRLPLSPRLTRSVSSTYVVSSVPLALSGAVIGMRPKMRNCVNLTATRDFVSGVRSAKTCIGYCRVSRFYSTADLRRWRTLAYVVSATHQTARSQLEHSACR